MSQGLGLHFIGVRGFAFSRSVRTLRHTQPRTEYVPGGMPGAGDTEVDVSGRRCACSCGQHISTRRKAGQVIRGASDREGQSTQRDRDKGNVPQKGNLSRIWDRAGVEAERGRWAREAGLKQPEWRHAP